MAGGERLLPNKHVPKPMPLSAMSLLNEHRTYVSQVRDISLITYPESIEQHFGMVIVWREIKLLQEDNPLGTAGG